MWFPLLLARLATSTLVLNGVRYPAEADPSAEMLRDGGDLWSPPQPGSNVLPCGAWGPMATRLNVKLGEPFVLTGTVPATAGGGVLTVDGIFDPSPNFNLAGVLYQSRRFSIQDVGGSPTNFSLPLSLPSDSPLGPVSLQVKFVSLEAKHPFYQCVDLMGVPHPDDAWLSPWGWWLVGISLGVIILLICVVVYCICKRSSGKSKDVNYPTLPNSPATNLGVSERPKDAAFNDVSVQDPREVDSDREFLDPVSDVEIEHFQYEDHPHEHDDDRE